MRPISVPRSILPLALASVALCACQGDEPGPPPDPAVGDQPLPAAPDVGASGWFADVTAASGLRFVHAAGLTPEKHLPETMAPGAALADLDGDGLLDAYLVQSGALPLAGRDAPRDPAVVNRLFLGNGGAGAGLAFRDVTAASGAAADPGYGMGVAAGDIDLDGDLDLLVTNFGPDVLLINEGSARFRDGTAGSGYSDERWTTSAAFFDADGDGLPDLYVASYLQVDLTDPRWCGRREPGWRSACHPDTYPGLPDRFWRNLGGARFRDDTAAAGVDLPEAQGGKGLGVAVLDADADGDLDVYVANDSTENHFWLNTGDGRFVDHTLVSGTGVNGRGLTEAGMGLAQGDVDGDGDLDLFKTNFDDEANTLYRNDGQAGFSDDTARAGLDAPSRPWVGFGTVMADLDNDADLDLAVVNGHIIDNIHLYADGRTHAQPALLFRNGGRGVFENASGLSGALCDTPRVGRGLYDGDLDRDGDLDLLVTTCGGPAVVLRNDGPPDVDTVGASVVIVGLVPCTRVEARLDDGTTLLRQAGPSASYLGQGSPELHLGLGQRALTGLRLRSPQGPSVDVDFPTPLRAGRLLRAEDGTVQPLPPTSGLPTPRDAR